MLNNKWIKLALTSTLLLGCANNTNSSSSATLQTYNNMLMDSVFDTSYQFRETGYDVAQSEEHYETSVALLREYSDLYDIYNTYPELNNLKTINDNAGIQPVKVDQKIIDLLLEAKKFYDYSDGEFDITIGSLLKVWA